MLRKGASEIAGTVKSESRRFAGCGAQPRKKKTSIYTLILSDFQAHNRHTHHALYVLRALCALIEQVDHVPSSNTCSPERNSRGGLPTEPPLKITLGRRIMVFTTTSRGAGWRRAGRLDRSRPANFDRLAVSLLRREQARVARVARGPPRSGGLWCGLPGLLQC